MTKEKKIRVLAAKPVLDDAEIFGSGTKTGAIKSFIEERCILSDAVKNSGGIL